MKKVSVVTPNGEHTIVVVALHSADYDTINGYLAKRLGNVPTAIIISCLTDCANKLCCRAMYTRVRVV